MIRIFIDTSDNKKIFVRIGSKTKTVSIESGFVRSETCLPIIDEMLKKSGLTIHDINEINVNEGPGSFTGLRVGVSIANALSFLLRIPINQKKIGEVVLPIYN